MMTLLTWGRFIISASFNNGFGVYLESLPEQLRAADVELAGEITSIIVSYNAIAFKLPLLCLEFGTVSEVAAMPDVSDIVNELQDEILNELKERSKEDE